MTQSGYTRGMTLTDEAQDVLTFWLGPLDDLGLADEAHRALWWQKDPDFDTQLRQRFLVLHTHLTTEGLPSDWRIPKARLAAVIVLDQFSRNMFRDTAQMFSSDAQARDLAAALHESGDDRGLHTHERVFAYMPFMHSELLEDQRVCLDLLTELHAQSQGAAADSVAGNIEFAKQHLAIIERFGRFPHRNAILGRKSTPEEQAFLTQPGSSF